MVHRRRPTCFEKIMRDLDIVRDELKAANAWVFGGVLHPPSTATVVRVKDGETLLMDGPYVEGKEDLGGFTIIRAPDLDAALEWGRKIARATGGKVTLGGAEG